MVKCMIKPETWNIASYLAQQAATQPEAAAVIAMRMRRGQPHYTTITFTQLESLSNHYAGQFQSGGIASGMRALVLVRPGIEWVTIIFALLKIGAVPTLIDAGMGVANLVAAIRQIQPEALIAIPQGQILRLLHRSAFRSVRINFTVGKRWGWGGLQLATRPNGGAPVVCYPARADETAAILFTSGSTGPAKGVVYEHGMFMAQVQAIRDTYRIQPGEMELATFPLFALFCPALGMSCLLPEMDFSHPGKVDPQKIVRCLQDHPATSSFGSPALWTRVAEYCRRKHIQLNTLRRVLMAGAPIPYPLIEQVKSILPPQAEVYTPYGATEALPVASISGSEILRETAALTRSGKGICVGKPLTQVELRIIKISDDAIDRWSDGWLCPPGEIGEIAVSGANVTRSYAQLPEATRLAKIRDGDRVWHRMGDVGYLDELGRLWYGGRKSHRVEGASGLLFSNCCEAVFEQHLAVARAALVRLAGPDGSAGFPAIAIEPRRGHFPRGTQRLKFIAELQQLARQVPMAQPIEHFYFFKTLPVDVRHNAKINRELLADWIEAQR
ncbi:MAG: Tyrocidine synthase 3 [Phycisphaerae bacterium]|nr:Tyrocidine synthase 3 [Phycisphaerae bacterium]